MPLDSFSLEKIITQEITSVQVRFKFCGASFGKEDNIMNAIFDRKVNFTEITTYIN